MTTTSRPPFRARPFRIAGWATNPHAQTLLARFLRSARGAAMVRERWELPDGDFLDLDLGPDPGPGAPLALLLHGLEGGSDRSYVLNVCSELLARGIRPVAMNFRGCSGEMNRLPRLYHSGETSDAALVLTRLRRDFPGRRLGALGFSLGGNVLLKLLGEREDGGAGLLDAAVAFSAPMDLGAGCDLLDRTPMGRAYTRYFLRSLKRKVRAKADLLEGLVDLEAVLASRTLREFDDAATARIHGFRDASEYYRLCSGAAFVAGIRIPTLVLHALDDPFLPPDAFPRAALEANPTVTAVVHPLGGHVGFLEGPSWAPRYWGDEEGARFLAETLGAA
ncbi:MAG TPA: alpha/beta fold hydrolase [Longimicrobiales bacterium]|nr:alpha/beta fold hydrolase [Longimicrobiales bacterium]